MPDIVAFEQQSFDYSRHRETAISPATTVLPAGREFICKSVETLVSVQTNKKLQNCFEKVLKFWTMYYYYKLGY